MPNKPKEDLEKKEMVDVLVLNKVHLTILITLAILTPTISAYTAYNSAVKSVDKAEMEEKIAQIRFEVQDAYVHKTDFQQVKGKIDRIAEDVAEMKGYMRRGR